MVTAQPRLAGELAGRRAAECRERLAALNARGRHRAADAARARESLSRARIRAVNAQLSAAEREAAFRGVDVTPMHHLELLRRIDDLHLTPAAFFQHYWALGGRCSRFDVDAHLHIGIALPRLERMIIEHAIWELGFFMARSQPL